MARSSRTTIVKRQRELRKAEKAAMKRARRHGKAIAGQVEPGPTLVLGNPEAKPGPSRENGET